MKKIVTILSIIVILILSLIIYLFINVPINKEILKTKELKPFGLPRTAL